MTAPATVFAVGVRALQLSRGADRPLRTVVWYPVNEPAGRMADAGAPVAPGRYPVVLFSHGLDENPESYADTTTRLAAAGFVVAAPAYPHTNAQSSPLEESDELNQPADASAVLDAVLALDRGTDALAGHLLATRVASVGHSLGGFTTTALFGVARDPRVIAGVVLSGGTTGNFQGTPAPLLFVHGDDDDVVKYGTGHAAFDRDPWPKAFLTVLDGKHYDYLTPRTPAFSPVLATVTDFLRWTLYGDGAAHEALATDADMPGMTRWESTL
jgi:dienelactone hydrolase